MQQQLTLGIHLAEENTFANYFPGKNAEVVALLKRAVKGEGEQIIYLYGPSGIGKTHLLFAAIDEIKTSIYIALRSIEQMKESVFDGLEDLSGVVIDDINYLAGKILWEEAFLDFYNRMVEKNRFLIISGNVLPHYIPFHLKDIVSRLNAAVTFQVRELEEEEKLYALVKRAKTRGFSIPDRVVRFLLRRYPRDLGSLFAALDVLDQASLAEKRLVTVPFVKQVLGL